MTDNILNVLTDIIYVMKLLLFCDVIFRFDKYKITQRYIEVVLLTIIVSELMYLMDSHVEALLFFTHIYVIMFLLYREEKKLLVCSSIWLIFISAIFDEMNIVLVEMLKNLTGAKILKYDRFFASVNSFIFIIILSMIYKKKYSIGIKNIGVKKIIFFSILSISNAFIAMTIYNLKNIEVEESYAFFLSIASIFVVIGMLVQLAAVILLNLSNSIIAQNEQMAKIYLKDQEKHYIYLEEREIETKKFRHDLRNHMILLTALAREKKYSDFDEYIKKINEKINDFGNHITVNNGIVDAILNKYYSEAIKKNINFNVKGRIPDSCNIDAYDLCTVFSNIMSNAIEAVEYLENKNIYLECKYTEDNIIIIEKNEFSCIDTNTFETTKNDKHLHGFGMKNIKSVIEKNGGELNISTDNNIFCIIMMLRR